MPRREDPPRSALAKLLGQWCRRRRQPADTWMRQERVDKDHGPDCGRGSLDDRRDQRAGTAVQNQYSFPRIRGDQRPDNRTCESVVERWAILQSL